MAVLTETELDVYLADLREQMIDALSGFGPPVTIHWGCKTAEDAEKYRDYYIAKQKLARPRSRPDLKIVG